MIRAFVVRNFFKDMEFKLKNYYIDSSTVIIFVIAFIIRIVNFYLIKGSFLFGLTIGDDHYYNNWAINTILKGDWLSTSRGVFFMNPGYPYFLAFLYSFFPKSVYSIMLVQHLIGAATCSLVYLLAAKLFNKTVGIMSGLIASAYQMLIFYETRLLTTTLIIFLNLIILLTILYSEEKRKIKYYFIAGLCMGFSTLLRPTILFFLPFLVLFLVINNLRLFKWKIFSNWRDIFYKLLVLGAGLLLIIAPFMIRNYCIDKDIGFVLTTYNGGIVFYLANNIYSDGFEGVPPFVEFSTDKVEKSFKDEAEKREGKKFTWAGTSDYWLKESLKWIIKNPAQYKWLIKQKLKSLISNTEAVGNCIPEMVRTHKKLLRIPLFNWGIITSFGIMGLLLGLKNLNKLLLIYFYAISYFLVNIIFCVVSEYRFPLVPIMIIFTSSCVWYIYKFIIERKYLPIILTLIAITGLLYLSQLYSATPEDGSDFLIAGNAYEREGLIDQAIEKYIKCIKVAPTNIMARRNLALLYAGKGNLNEALPQLKKIIELKPDDKKAHYDTAYIYYKMGNYAESLKQLDELSISGSSGKHICKIYMMLKNKIRDR